VGSLTGNVTGPLGLQEQGGVSSHQDQSTSGGGNVLRYEFYGMKSTEKEMIDLGGAFSFLF